MCTNRCAQPEGHFSVLGASAMSCTNGRALDEEVLSYALKSFG